MGIITEYRIKENFEHNILSVIYDTDSFFYAISDLHDNLVSAAKYQLSSNPESEIKQIIEKENLSNHYYTEVKIFNRSDQFGFIPISEYEYDHEDAYVRNSFKKGENIVKVSICNKENIHIIHSLNSMVEKSLDGLVGEDSVKHSSITWIEGQDEDGLLLFFEINKLIISVRKNGEFIFYNHFNISRIEEILYFVMLTYQQLNLNVEIDVCTISGSDLEKLSNLISPYIRNVKEFGNTFNNMEKCEDITDLYLASICE